LETSAQSAAAENGLLQLTATAFL